MTLPLVGVAALAGLSYFAVAAVGHPAVSVVCAAVVGLGLAWVTRQLTRILEPGRPTGLRAPLVAGAAIAFGVLLHAMVGSWPSAIDGLAVGVAVLAGWSERLGRTGSAACSACKRPMDGAPGMAFVCPRCRESVCARAGCWNAKAYRCASCDERGVVLFPIVNSWWDTHFGPRVRHGSCGHCYQEAGEADLRECGKCAWPLCRRCWDHHNGVCPRCAWAIKGAPAAVVAMAARQAAGRGARGGGRATAARQPGD